MKIRIAQRRDVQQILQIYAPFVKNTTVTFEYEVPSEEEFAKRMETIQKKHLFLVAEDEGVIVGYAYSSDPFERRAYHFNAEISVYVREGYRKKGIGKALYEIIERVLFRLGYLRIYSLITSENEDSVLFHEKMGYKRVFEMVDTGYKFGRWISVIWMEKELRGKGNYSFPLAIGEIPQAELSEIIDGRIF